MKKYVVKGFNFSTKKDKDLLDYLDKQENQSSYIKKLIRKDMINSDDNDIKKVVKKYIEEYLRDKKIVEDKDMKTINLDKNLIEDILKI